MFLMLTTNTPEGDYVPENAIFVCFGGMSNVGVLTGLAALEAVKQLGPEQAGIFCLGGLPTEAPLVLQKTRAARRLITVDGCLLNCARKIVEQAGFTPDKTINLVQDCGIKSGQGYHGGGRKQCVTAPTCTCARRREG